MPDEQNRNRDDEERDSDKDEAQWDADNESHKEEQHLRQRKVRRLLSVMRDEGRLVSLRHPDYQRADEFAKADKVTY